jgi:hypothetical protein
MLKPCEKWNERLSAWLDGEGNLDERKAVEDHLAACPACRAAAEVMRCDAQDAAAALHARRASDRFAARVMGEVGVTKMSEDGGETAPAPRPWLGRLLKWQRNQLVALAIASASVLLLVIVVANNWQAADLQVNRPSATRMSPPASMSQAPAPDGRTTNAAGLPNSTSPSSPVPRDLSLPLPPPPTGLQDEAAGGKLPATPQPTIIPPELNYGLADKLMIAYTASLSLRTKEVERAMEQAELLFREYDGFVLTSQYELNDKGKATATVVGRVPSAQLGELLVDLDGLGELQTRTVNGEDLTAKQLEQIEKLGDLALKQQFLSKIEGRANTNTALNVESRRADARTEATGIRVDQYKLKSRVTLADVTVHISNPPVKKPKPDPVKQSASKSFRSLRAFGLWTLTVILIPLGIWLPVWGPLMVLGIVLRRRYRGRG